MERRDWIVYPWQVDAQVAEWQARYPALLDVTFVRQYTQHKVYALTVTDSSIPPDQKRKHLFYVPHAHEPAGTAGCMNFISQLLSGHHVDGTPSTLVREPVLQRAVLTFIPDANPFGRARCPEPFWDGSRYNNREFINMVFGMGDHSSVDPCKPQWERFKRVDAFSTAGGVPTRLGLVYEQVDDAQYVEPGRYNERASLVQLIGQLRASYTYDQMLSIHQTEFEGRDEDCEAILPDLQPQLSPERQAYNRQWAELLNEAWSRVGGRPRTELRTGLFRSATDRLQLHQRMRSGFFEELQREAALLTLEVRNNHPETSAEQQLLLMDTALWRSVEYLLNAG